MTRFLRSPSRHPPRFHLGLRGKSLWQSAVYDMLICFLQVELLKIN